MFGRKGKCQVYAINFRASNPLTPQNNSIINYAARNLIFMQQWNFRLSVHQKKVSYSARGNVWQSVRPSVLEVKGSNPTKRGSSSSSFLTYENLRTASWNWTTVRCRSTSIFSTKLDLFNQNAAKLGPLMSVLLSWLTHSANYSRRFWTASVIRLYSRHGGCIHNNNRNNK